MKGALPVLPIAADIAAWLRVRADATPSTGLQAVMHAGKELLGVDVIGIYWHATKEVDVTAPGKPNQQSTEQLLQRMRHLLWPWLQSEFPASNNSAYLLPDHLQGDMEDPVQILPLYDSDHKLGGLIALVGELKPVAEWNKAAIDVTQVFSAVVRQELTLASDPDTALLNREAFISTSMRWMSAQKIEDATSTLLVLEISSLIDLEICGGHRLALTALREVLALLKTRMRSRDVIGRVDRHTIAVLLKQCDENLASSVVKSLMDAVKGHRFATNNRVYDTQCTPLCISVDHDSDISQLLPGETFAQPGPVELIDSDTQTQSNIIPFKAMTDVSSEAETVAELKSDLVSFATMRVQPGVLLQNTDAIACYRLRVFGEQPGDATDSLDIAHCRSVIDEVANNLSLQQRSLVPVLVIDVSASFLDATKLEWLLSSCTQSRVPLSTFCLAFSEKDLMNELDSALATLSSAHRDGLQLMLKSPGTSPYSYYLQKQLPIDFLELPAGIVVDAVQDDFKRAMLQAQVLVAHSLNMQVVASNIDSQALLKFANSLGIDIGTGKLCGRSVGIESIGLDKLAGD